jgi:hypothetical protein
LSSGSNLFIYNDALVSISGSVKVTGSIISTIGITGPINATNNVVSGSSQIGEIVRLQQATASLNTYTGSNDNVVARILQTTASLNTTTGSFSAIVNQILQTTASLNSKTGSYATTGSNTFIGTETISGSLILTGSLLMTGSITITSGSITMPHRPGFRVTGAGGPKVAVTALSGSYLNVDWQQGSGWDNSTGTFTAPIAGLYQVNVIVRTNSNSLAAISQLIVYKNNTGGTTGTTQIMVEFGNNTSMNHVGGSTISKLAVGDTLKMVVATGEISFDVNDNFSVAYIG